MSDSHWPYGLFSVYGIEIEYMIVDAETLDVRPWADRILRDDNEEIVTELRHGPVSWCNELAAHVLELKCAEPAPGLQGLAAAFADNVRAANQALAAHGGLLLPGGMHPWMDPDTELVLWRQENREIYQAYDRIFGCRGHGWANLQSLQINLPFANDAEFGHLHAAIRLVLPLLGGLTASTPVMDGRAGPRRCNRMEVYRLNSSRIPSVTGAVVPEAVFDIASYHSDLLQPMYRDIAPHDPGGVLQEEWLNSRGAIARFDRGSIEIRTMDSQECPSADLAVAELVCALVQALTEERWSTFDAQRALTTEALAAVFLDTIERAEATELDHRDISQALGLTSARRSLASLWGALADRLSAEGALSRECQSVVEHILAKGTMATRMLGAMGDDTSRQSQHRVWRSLADCLAEDRLFG